MERLLAKYKFKTIMYSLAGLLLISFLAIILTLNTKFGSISANVVKMERHPITVLLTVKDIKIHLIGNDLNKALASTTLLEERFLGDKSQVLKLQELVRNNDIQAALVVASELESFALNKLDTFIGNITQVITDSKFILICIVALVLFLVCGLIYFVTKGMVKYLSSTSSTLALLSKGEINHMHHELLEGESEIANLTLSCKNLSQELASITQNLNLVSTNVSRSSQELNQVTSQSATSAQQELVQIEQASKVIDELSSTAEKLTLSAAQAKTETQNATNNVHQGNQSLDNSIELTEAINQSVQDTANILSELQTCAVDIGQVTSVIDSISEQTNLLALNASIEAARAGESGRGFAVVADEVRSLASKTRSSTKDIQEIVSRLQAQSEHANTNMANNVSSIQESVELSKTVKTSFDAISQSVQTIADINAIVDEASKEQNRVTQSVADSINQTSALVNDNVTAINLAQSAADKLESLADSQSKELAFFKSGSH